MSELDPFIAFAHQLADVSARETLPRFRAAGSVDNKLSGGFDPVTDADREAERAIRSRIEARFPEHGILGEEHGEHQPGARLRWVLDPVDGTRGFICGAPTWTTLIALERDGEPVVGMIDQPHVQERWVGTDARTVFRHGTRETTVTASGCQALAQARISTTDPRTVAYFNEAEAAAFAELANRCQLARFGMDAYAYALLASGQLDLVVESGLAHHDYAALAPVVRGAGGVITDWRGNPFDVEGGGHALAAATPQLHAAAMAVLVG